MGFAKEAEVSRAKAVDYVDDNNQVPSECLQGKLRLAMQ